MAVPIATTPEGIPDRDTLPVVPSAERFYLRGRGTMAVRRIPGPAGAPTVVLLHGWIATGALNWFLTFDDLSAHFNVIAPDMRGHGGGIRTRRRFTLADCADDVAALLDHLDTGPVIACGYSMGGPVSQLLWKRHPDLVEGAVLCATGAEFVTTNRERYAMSAFMTAMAGTTWVGTPLAWLPGQVTRRVMGMPLSAAEPDAVSRWAREEMSGHSVRSVLEAGHAIAHFSSKKWIHRMDVPTTVVVTNADSAVSPVAQHRLAAALPDACIIEVDDGHIFCAQPEFGPVVTQACLDVAGRIAKSSSHRSTSR